MADCSKKELCIKCVREHELVTQRNGQEIGVAKA